MWNLLNPIPKIQICPILANMMAQIAQILAKFKKKLVYFESENAIFEIWNNLTQIWPFAYLAKWAPLQISVRCFKMCKILN